MRVSAWIPIVVVAALAAPLAACLPSMDFGAATPDAGAAAVAVDDASILARVANGAYRRDPRFVEVTRQSYPSAIAPANLNVWVTAADYAAFDHGRSSIRGPQRPRAATRFRRVRGRSALARGWQ